jgi:hypothetical protein
MAAAAVLNMAMYPSPRLGFTRTACAKKYSAARVPLPSVIAAWRAERLVLGIVG